LGDFSGFVSRVVVGSNPISSTKSYSFVVHKASEYIPGILVLPTPSGDVIGL